MTAVVHRAEDLPPLKGDWDHEAWAPAETLLIDQFRPESSDHRPKTEVRILYDTCGLHLVFRVQDRYVRSVQTEINSAVCTDSCVEFFVCPRDACGYLNFEVNCGGVIHCSHIEDHTRTSNGFAKYRPLSTIDAARIGIHHSMPTIVDPEIAEPTTWINQLFIPFDVISEYTGDIGDVADQTWRGNFYKCGDKTSHPHWAAWAPVRELNFHDPSCFGQLHFSA